MEMGSADIVHEEKLWRLDDVTSYLRCSKVQVWRHIRQRGLPCFKLGGRTSPLLFHEEEVKAWAEEQRMLAAS